MIAFSFLQKALPFTLALSIAGCATKQPEVNEPATPPAAADEKVKAAEEMRASIDAAFREQEAKGLALLKSVPDGPLVGTAKQSVLNELKNLASAKAAIDSVPITKPDPMELLSSAHEREARVRRFEEEFARAIARLKVAMDYLGGFAKKS